MKLKRYYIILKEILFNIITSPVLLMPLKNNKVVFSNFNGKGFGDNPKYIADELLMSDDIDMVWLVSSYSVYTPKRIRKVKIGTLRAYFELRTAKVWVDNIRNTMKPSKRKKQFYIQTWHGSYGPKLAEGEIVEHLSTDYKKKAKKDGYFCDLILSGNKLQEIQMRNFFWLNKNTEIMRVGLPRNDSLLNSVYTKRRNDEIRKKININENVKVFLYMPTYRDNGDEDVYRINFEYLIEALENDYDNVIILLRLHPNVKFDSSELISEKVIDLSEYPDPQDLLIVSDFLITDYSSAAFDFSLLKKPIFLYVPDYQEYKSYRGISPIFEEYPFPKAFSIEQLISLIDNFDAVEYTKKISSFFEKYESYETGISANIIANKIKSIINNEKEVEK